MGPGSWLDAAEGAQLLHTPLLTSIPAGAALSLGPSLTFRLPTATCGAVTRDEPFLLLLHHVAITFPPITAGTLLPGSPTRSSYLGVRTHTDPKWA